MRQSTLNSSRSTLHFFMTPNNLSNVPTGIKTDPNADEQVIDQTGEQPDDLANALAYAIDGSGTGVAGAPPVAPTEGETQKVITEGTTGAGPAQEDMP
jgi:hypothetical protein